MGQRVQKVQMDLKVLGVQVVLYLQQFLLGQKVQQVLEVRLTLFLLKVLVDLYLLWVLTDLKVQGVQ